MHDAFQVTTVVDKMTRIESIFAHGIFETTNTLLDNEKLTF